MFSDIALLYLSKGGVYGAENMGGLEQLNMGGIIIRKRRMEMKNGLVSVLAVIVVFVGVQAVLSSWPLTVNNYHDANPQIDGRLVVWEGFDGNDSEIFLYDGRSIIQLTNNSYQDARPQISRRNVVWMGFDGNDLEIFLYDGKQTILLTHNNIMDFFPEISGGDVVWECQVGGTDSEIFHRNIRKGITTQVTNNSDEDWYPVVSRSGIVWMGGDETDFEIHFSPIPKLWK